MKSVFSMSMIAGVLLFAPAAFGAQYKIDPAHSQVLFKIKHLGISSVSGRFDKFEGTIDYDAANVAASSTEATIDVSSINTNIVKRDNHLRSPDFFSVEKFAAMTFKSKKITAKSKTEFDMVGDLTMHGVTKEITLHTVAAGEAAGPDGKMRAAFVAEGSLNRKEFGLKWSELTESGGVLVGDDVKVTLEIEAVKQ